MQILRDARDLKRKPTLRKWTVELLRIKKGERAPLLEQASYEDWIDQLLGDAETPATSEAIFLEALQHVVQSWQPAAADSGELEAMVGLIGAYTPRDAQTKLFLAFDAANEHGGPEAPRTLQWILDVLHQYYPTTPLEDTNKEYEGYLSLLRRSVGIRGCELTAARRLVERDANALLDPQVLRLVRGRPAFISDLVDFALETTAEELQKTQLQRLHECVVLAGSKPRREFVKAIEAKQGKYETKGSTPWLTLPGSPKQVPLTFESDRTRRIYVTEFNSDMQSAKFEIFRKVEREATELAS